MLRLDFGFVRSASAKFPVAAMIGGAIPKPGGNRRRVGANDTGLAAGQDRARVHEAEDCRERVARSIAPLYNE